MTRKEKLHIEARGLQMVANQPRNIRVILNDKNARSHKNIVAGQVHSCAVCNLIETIQLISSQRLVALYLDDQVPVTIKPESFPGGNDRSCAVFRDDGRSGQLSPRG
jgi:hypothetical protein